MSELQYSNRELDAKFREVHEKLDEIIAQTTQTNGKVKKIILALVAIAAFSFGMGLEQLAPIVSLFL